MILEIRSLTSKPFAMNLWVSKGFDINKVPDPTAPENIGSVHGRGIHVMKALMDEVRFEEGGSRYSYEKVRPDWYDDADGSVKPRKERLETIMDS